MITIRLFARLREQVGLGEFTFSSDLPVNVTELLKQLNDQQEKYQWSALAQAKVLCAINHQQVNFDHMVHDGDEIAFFPPVTGG